MSEKTQTQPRAQSQMVTHPSKNVGSDISKIEFSRALFDPLLSPIRPKMAPPTGRARKATLFGGMLEKERKEIAKTKNSNPWI